MLRDYLEITRLFNMGLTGVAPVLGAFSMWTEGTLNLFKLLILFFIGCLSHAYGFILNDIIDIKVDKLSTDLTARPLVRGSISRQNAAIFAISCLVLSFILTWFFFSDLRRYLIMGSFLVIAYASATIYDALSKKYPGMDIFVAGAVFFLILFGASTIGPLSLLAWVVAFIGGLQVLFMNMINGAIKDIDHDEKGLARTFAIRLGAKVQAGVITLPVSFKTTGYGIELIRSVLIFLPFIVLGLPYDYWQLGLLVFLTALIFFMIYKLYAIRTFDRSRIRRFIGIIVIFMYATTPVMLSSLDWHVLLVALIPPLWFFCSNLLLHRTIFEPKTM